MLLGERLERPVLAREDDITDIINRIFGESTRSEGSVSDVLGDSVNAIDEFNEDAVEDLLEDSSEAPFIRLVNMILAQAVRAGASDIHIEPYRDVSRVRFRLDGVLYERHTLNKAHHAAVVSRIKVMAKLNIAEKRLPQDGRIAISLGGRQAGLRVSTLPTSFGERVVLRLLEKSERVLSLTELGLSREDLQLMHSLVGITHGIVLVTGPTGSGKTTTLYAVLQELTAPDKNILTIEDPVEYELEGVGQIQVNPKIGLTFADGLRSIVRQDPDVILIGEIRDAETAAIAVQSALTGHLVFSTLHTNDAPGAVTRLFDMGVEPFLLSSVLRGVVAQRLVRMLCPHCREAYLPDGQELEKLGAARSAYRPGQPLYRAKGCPDCLDTGYRGRMAIYEIMPVSDALKRLIVDKADANVLGACALSEAMRNLRHDGMLKVIAGLTSLTEVARVTNE
ncbi:type II secretion system ATPase GspE [Bilophila wadsworthia]